MNDSTDRNAPLPSVEELQAFRDGCQSLILATLNADGAPEASYTPYVEDAAGHVYIFVSGLARHTQNLARDGRVSVLLIEDEAAAPNPHARRRLTLTCRARPVAREDEAWGPVLDQFEGRFGKMMQTQRGLVDFQLFHLTIEYGVFVRGFGQAYRVSGPGLVPVTRVRPEK
jgi:putative heme iron utilization protein